MTALDQVQDFLLRLAPKAACDDCIADQLKLTPRQHANHKTRELAKIAGFSRSVGECHFCKAKTKKVIGCA